MFKKEILNTIITLSKIKSPLIIAINGLGGSGKTTVAQMLKQNLPNVSIVEFDDFYSQEIKGYDSKRLYREVIKQLKEGKDVKYQIMDPKTNMLTEWRNIKHQGIIIIEGVFTMQEKLINFYDYKIWVEYDPDLAAERGIKRDGEHKREIWLNEWLPTEKEYKETYKPQDKADYVIKV